MSEECKPQIHVLKVEETENWAPEIVEKAGKLFGVYVFDKHKHVHCCEFTPSYECIFIESQYTNLDLSEHEQEKLEDDIREGNREESVRYYHVSDIDALPTIKQGETKAGTFNLECEDEEEAEEYCRCNSV